MQYRDKRILRSLNTDDAPDSEQFQQGDVTDAFNVRMGSSDQQHGEGNAESLQGEVEVLLAVSAEIIYYGDAIGGDFIYSGFSEVQIGNQVWMKNNWNEDYPGSKVYDNIEANADIYGRLYNHSQISESNFCPAGWRIPTEADIDELLTYLGGELIAGGKMKDVGTELWTTPNTGADNVSGFRAVPGGKSDTVFSLIGQAGYLWLLDEGEPKAPVALNGSEIDTNEFIANWLASEGATGYYLDVATDALFTSMVGGYDGLDVGNVLLKLVSGLSDGVQYFYRVRAYNEIGTSLNSNSKDITTDIIPVTEVVIGTQTWQTYNVSDNIPGSRVYLDNETLRSEYGGLYSWSMIAAIEAANPGYHVPTIAELTTLVNFLGGASVAGGHLKESGYEHWTTPNTGADNTSGFTALGCGYYSAAGYYHGFNVLTGIWSKTSSSTPNAYGMQLFNDQSLAQISIGYNKLNYMTVRLIKD